MAEFAQLFGDPMYYGIGAARGDGRHVVVLPGLFGNDWYLYPLRSWLSRIGYRPCAVVACDQRRLPGAPQPPGRG